MPFLTLPDSHMGEPAGIIRQRLSTGTDRFDQARVVVLDVADPRAHGRAGHLVEGERRQQSLERGCLDRLFAESTRPRLGFQDYRHAVVEMRAQLVRGGGDDREGST